MSSLRIPEKLGRAILDIRAEELRQKRALRNQDAAKNLPNSVVDVTGFQFPAEWMLELRRVSPISKLHSFLMPYWYRAGQRWVLYDVQPMESIVDDMDTGSGISGKELKEIMTGPRPSEREDWKSLDHFPVSDAQHEMWRVWRGFARPFWVLQGESGGHQVKFSPQQSQALLRMGLPAEPPRIGELAPCPFDNRASGQLQHLNRLHQVEDSIERLRQSGSPEAAQAENDRLEREVRESEMAFVEAQMRPLVDMAMSLRQRSEHDDQLVHVPSGMASRANDAYQRYQETGDWTL